MGYCRGSAIEIVAGSQILTAAPSNARGEIFEERKQRGSPSMLSGAVVHRQPPFPQNQPKNHVNTLLPPLITLQHRLNHLIPDLHRPLEPRLKKPLRHRKPLPPRLKLPQPHALGPPARGDGELQVVAAKRVVLDAHAQRLVEQPRRPKQVLGHAQPQAEQRRAADHVVVGDDVHGAPAVDHGEEGEVVIREGRVRGARGREAEAVEDVGAEERARRPLGAVLGAEDFLLGGVDAGAQLGPPALEHEGVEVGGGARELGDLLVGFGVEDGEAGVDVPLLGVDAEHEVDLYVFDAADVARPLPRELGGGVPGLAHGEEGGVGHGLGVGRDAVVLARAEVDVLGAEAAEDGFDFGEGGGRGAVLDEDEGLAAGVEVGAVEGVARDDVDVAGEVLFKGLDLGVLA
jgi:hypothetical protein